jgi:hypothetical protein
MHMTLENDPEVPVYTNCEEDVADLGDGDGVVDGDGQDGDEDPRYTKEDFRFCKIVKWWHRIFLLRWRHT